MSYTTVNEVRASFTALQEHYDDLLDMVTGQIKDQASPDGDMGWLQHCAAKVELLQTHRKTLQALEEEAIDVLKNTLSFESDEVAVTPAGLRTLTIEVSQGMLNQHLLTLTEAKKRGLVREGEQFSIRLPDGTEFTTELCDPGNKLRERGLIRKFYQDAKISDGDRVFLTEVIHGTWKLLSPRSDEGKALEAASARNRYFGGSEEKLLDESSNPSKTP